MQPDPEHPSIANASFENVLMDAETGVETPAGWHYQRQLTLATDPSHAPDGKRFLTFHNVQPGRGCHALQGFAVDGRKVAKLRLSFSARGHDILPGPEPEQQPGALITFYDDRRALIGGGRPQRPLRDLELGARGKDDSRAAQSPRGNLAHRPVGRNGRAITRRHQAQCDSVARRISAIARRRVNN